LISLKFMILDIKELISWSTKLKFLYE